MTNPTQPNQVAGTAHNVSDRVWCLQREKNRQPQRKKPASRRACLAKPEEQLPAPGHRHKPLLPPNHKCTSCSCPHTAHTLSASDTQQWTLLSVRMQSSLELTDGEGPTQGILMSSLEFRTLRLLSAQPHPWSPGTPSNFIQQPEHPVMQQKVQASAFLSHRSSWFYVLLRPSLNKSRTTSTPPGEAMLPNTEV